MGEKITRGTQLSVIILESMAGVDLAHSAHIYLLTPNLITMKEDWKKISRSLKMKLFYLNLMLKY